MRLIVSLHDVHPSSLTTITRQRDELRALGVTRCSLLVVPHWHGGEQIEFDSAFLETLNRWRAEGDEIVLHGWRHDCVDQEEKWHDLFWTRAYTSREAEFIGVSAIEAHDRIVAGRRIWEKAGWTAEGFIAPAWLMNRVVVEVLRLSGFAYTVTRTSIVPLANGAKPLVSPSLCYSTRTAWRRRASLVWNARLARRVRHNPLQRISIHPRDADYPEIWRQIIQLTGEALDQGRQPVTYAEVVAGLRRSGISASNAEFAVSR